MTCTLSRAKQLSVRLLVLIATMALILSVGLLSPMLARAEGAIVTWTGGAGDGSWHTAGNWDGGQIPSTGDTVIIPATSVVEYASGTISIILQSAGNLTVSGGTLNTAGDSFISGKIVNNGVIAINGTSLTLSGGGEGSGEFQVYGGKLLKFTGGTYTIGGNVKDLGNCAYMIAEGSGTNVTFNGSYNIVNSTVSSNAKATWNGTSNSIGVLNANGQVVFNQKVTIQRLNLTGGTIDGSGDIAIDPTKDIFNPSTWTAGTMTGNGTLEVVSGGKLSIEGSGTKSLNRGVLNRGEISFLNTPPTILSTIAFKNEGLVRTDANCSSNVTISSYNQTTTGTLQIDIDSSAFTKLSTNIPTLEGTLHLFFKGTPTAGTSYDLISYTQKPGTQFTSVTSNLADFDMQQVYGDKKLTVTVTKAGQTSTEAEITAFNFARSTGSLIDYAAGTINVMLPHGTDVTNLVPTFTLSSGSSAKVGDVPQVSGTTSNNFTTPVTYVVTAEDGVTTRDWTVNVKIMEPGTPSVEPLWDYRSPWPTSNILWETKYLNGKFMALGNNGTIISSIDGEHWEAFDLKTKATLKGIAYGNGRYVAIGYDNDDGVIYGSIDGVNWSLLATTTYHQLTDIIFGNNKFVAVGQGGKIVISNDGENWNLKNDTNLESLLHSIIYANGSYVAVGYDGLIVSSSNGENWTKLDRVGYTMWDVAYGNDKFVAVGGESGTEFICTSTDGVSWTEHTNYSGERLDTIAYNGSQFIAAPNLGSNAYVLTSSDGTNWTRQDLGVNVRFSAIASNSDKWIAVGGYGEIASSIDGTNWIRRNFGTRQILLDVTHNGNMFVSVGDAGIIQTSPDGITWTIGNSGTTERLWAVEYLNGKLIAVGDNGVILTSDDGTSWISKTSNTSQVLYDVAFGNGMYVAVGGDTSNAMVTSNDGETWTFVNTGYSIPFVTVTYGNGTFIALGQNGQVYKSTDGSQWPQTDLPGSGNYPKDIIYADGRFIATGENGKIYVSNDDGENWTVAEKVDGVNDCINSVAYGGGNLAVVTSYGKILSSSDKGNTWTQQTSGFEHQLDLYGVAAGKSNFVAVGDRGLTLQSRDFGTPGNPDADAVAADIVALTWDTIKGANSTENNVNTNLINPLPTTGSNGTAITWSASPTGWINTSTGEVTRPTSAQGNQTVTFTAAIRKGSASDTKSFTLTIKAMEFAGGSGSEEDPYLVANADQLYNVRNHLDKHFRQTENIDLSGYNADEGGVPIGSWEPIGSEESPFTGTFISNGKSISNLTINQSTTGYAGLFGVTEATAQIKNVKLVNVNVIGSYHVGSLAGCNYGLVTDSYVTGDVIGDNTGYYTGGLVGINEGTITNCHTEATVTGGNSVGGLAGFNFGSITNSYTAGTITGINVGGEIPSGRRVGGLVGDNQGLITNSYAIGDVKGISMVGGLVGRNTYTESRECEITASYSTCTVEGSTYVGGLVGDNRGLLTNSYATGDVKGNSKVGGLVAYNEDSIVNCYSIGAVIGTEDYGGLVGSNNGGTVTNSYWDTQASGLGSSADGEDKTTEQMKEQKTYGGWDFNDTWRIEGSRNDGYPFLKNNPPAPYVKYAIVANVVGGTATVSTNPAAETTEGVTVTVSIANIEASKQFKSITVTDVDSGAVATTTVTSGKSYTFTMPAKAVTVTVAVQWVTTVVYGDVNDDGDIDVTDAVLVLKHITDSSTLNAQQQIAANVNGDTEIDITDAVLILKHITDPNTPFPIETP